MLRTVGAAGAATLLALAAAPAAGGFVALANHTEQPLRYAVVHEGVEPAAGTLDPGECRRVAVGRRPAVVYSNAGTDVRFRMTPYSAYVFAPEGKGVKLHRVEFAGALPRADDVPEKPAPAGRPVTVAVRVLVDDADPRARAAWEKALRDRVAAASAVFERQCGVAFEVADAGEWATDPATRDLDILYRDFERKVKPGRARVAIGYTSRDLGKGGNGTPTLQCLGPLRKHILIQETPPRSEPERVEVLAHQLGHWLGAVHVPDPNSALRPKLGDGRATATGYRLGLDPLNMLAVGIWVDALRDGKVTGWADLPPIARSRLLTVYRTLHELSPEDWLLGEHLAELDRLRMPARPAVKLPPKPAPEPELSPVQDGARKVVRAIAIRAADLRRQPASGRQTGDRLTAELVRTAADVALTLEAEHQAGAFLVGLGVGLDDSSVLRDNPLTRAACRAVESDDERRERLAVLGSPTVRGRRDLCQHFAVSAALAELVGPAGAEAAGVVKELLDAGRDSGFSFADLAADLAGIALATKLKADREHLRTVRARFAVEDYVPPVTGLREGVSRKQFQAEYGSSGDPRFQAVVEEIRRRVAELPPYRK